jgi:flagellar hook-length control protein FliK
VIFLEVQAMTMKSPPSGNAQALPFLSPLFKDPSLHPSFRMSQDSPIKSFEHELHNKMRQSEVTPSPKTLVKNSAFSPGAQKVDIAPVQKTSQVVSANQGKPKASPPESSSASVNRSDRSSVPAGQRKDITKEAASSLAAAQQPAEEGAELRSDSPDKKRKINVEESTQTGLPQPPSLPSLVAEPTDNVGLINFQAVDQPQGIVGQVKEEVSSVIDPKIDTKNHDLQPVPSEKDLKDPKQQPFQLRAETLAVAQGTQVNVVSDSAQQLSVINESIALTDPTAVSPREASTNLRLGRADGAELMNSIAFGEKKSALIFGNASTGSTFAGPKQQKSDTAENNSGRDLKSAPLSIATSPVQLLLQDAFSQSKAAEKMKASSEIATFGKTLGEAAAALTSSLGSGLTWSQTTSGTLPVSVEIKTHIQQPDFKEALGAQVSLLAKDGIQKAELRLNPADMGPIFVQIALDGSNARVDFSAESSVTRQLIENGLPELATALRESGITLTGGGVSQQPQQRQTKQEDDSNATETSGLSRVSSRQRKAQGETVLDELSHPNLPSRPKQGQIDDYV